MGQPRFGGVRHGLLALVHDHQPGRDWSSRSLNGARIVVVDDMSDARDLVRVALEAAGAHVTTASSATQVLTIIADESFDLLLADIGMPDRDGYSLIEAIRKKPSREGGKIPALAVTAYAGRADRERALAAGFDQHLAKPLELAALIEAVADLLAIGRV